MFDLKKLLFRNFGQKSPNSNQEISNSSQKNSDLQQENPDDTTTQTINLIYRSTQNFITEATKEIMDIFKKSHWFPNEDLQEDRFLFNLSILFFSLSTVVLDMYPWEADLKKTIFDNVIDLYIKDLEKESPMIKIDLFIKDQQEKDFCYKKILESSELKEQLKARKQTTVPLPDDICITICSLTAKLFDKRFHEYRDLFYAEINDITENREKPGFVPKRRLERKVLEHWIGTTPKIDGEILFILLLNIRISMFIHTLKKAVETGIVFYHTPKNLLDMEEPKNMPC